LSVTLYVWVVGARAPGHCSLLVGRTYMSYWPTEAAGKKDFKVNATHPAGFPSAYDVDRRLERRQCDHKVELHGLDESAMISAWGGLRRDPTPYNMVRHNCSTVVAALLETGSGVPPDFAPRVRISEHVSDWPTRLLLNLRFLSASIEMWTPDAVLKYAHTIQRRAPSR
jgi:hypothetical protein